MPYSFYRSVTIDSTKVGSSSHADFPVLISGTYSWLATEANGGKVKNASGFDIAFFSDSALTTQLKHETERYVAATGEVIYWVKVPTVSHSANTVIYVAYGDSGISTDQSDPTNVWDSNFLGIYHLSDGTTLSGADAKNTYNGTVTGASAATGKVNGGASFGGGSNTHRVVTSSMPAAGTTRTRSMWIYLNALDSATRRLYEIGSTNFRDALQISTSTLDFGVAWTNTALFTVSSPSTSNWHHIAVTYNGSSTSNDPIVYINGEPVSVTRATAPSGSLVTTNQTLVIGNRADNARCFNGLIDEVRISNSIRSADWIKAEYNNQNSPSTFYSVGSEVATVFSTSISGTLDTLAANFQGNTVFTTQIAGTVDNLTGLVEGGLQISSTVSTELGNLLLNSEGSLLLSAGINSTLAGVLAALQAEYGEVTAVSISATLSSLQTEFNSLFELQGAVTAELDPLLGTFYAQSVVPFAIERLIGISVRQASPISATSFQNKRVGSTTQPTYPRSATEVIQ